DRKSTRLNSSHLGTSYAVFCLKKISQDGRSILPHVRHHFRSTGFEKSEDKKRCNGQEDHVQHSRVIEADRHFDDLSAAMRRDQAECIENKFNQKSSDKHGNIENSDDQPGDFPAVVLAVDVDY